MCTYAMGSRDVLRNLSNTYNENFCKKSCRMKAGLCSVINVWEYPKYTSLVSLSFPQRAKIYIFELLISSTCWYYLNDLHLIIWTIPICPMGIARWRDVHRTSFLGPSVHVPYCTSIGRPFSVHCSRIDRRLIWTSNGRPKAAWSRTSNFSHLTLLFK